MIKYFFYGLLLYSLSGCNASKKEGFKKRQFTNGLFEVELLENSEKSILTIPYINEDRRIGLYFAAKLSRHSQLKITNQTDSTIFIEVKGSFLDAQNYGVRGKYLRKYLNNSSYYESYYNEKPDSMKIADRITGFKPSGALPYKYYEEGYDTLHPKRSKIYNFLHYEPYYVDTMQFTIRHYFKIPKNKQFYYEDKHTKIFFQRNAIKKLQIDSVSKFKVH
jgi:hypothetical protein